MFCNIPNCPKVRLDVKTKPAGSFIGFKVQCSGRFTRRQRARSYWFAIGSVPLNKIMAPIEYSAHTVPLINSAMTVKV